MLALVTLKEKALPCVLFALKETHQCKQEAIEVLQYLKKKKYDVWMITGDN